MDKPFKTIDEQIAILESRNMSTDSMTPLILKREGYYSVINGYKSLFLSGAETRRVGEDRYADGTAFKDVYRLFTFDRDLRMTMTRYFAQAEATLKTICAYRFSEAHTNESEPYLNPPEFCRHCEGVPNHEQPCHTPAQHKERASRADLKGGATMSDRSSSARGAGSHEPIARIA